MKNNLYIALALLLLLLLWLYFGSESKSEKNKTTPVTSDITESKSEKNKVISVESNIGEKIVEKELDASAQVEIKPKVANILSPFSGVSPIDKPVTAPKPVVKNQLKVKPAEIMTELPEVTEKPHPPYDDSTPPPPLKLPEQYPPDDGSLPSGAYR